MTGKQYFIESLINKRRTAHTLKLHTRIPKANHFRMRRWRFYHLFMMRNQLAKRKQKSNVSQLTSIVISEAANIRNNSIEMDVHNNT